MEGLLEHFPVDAPVRLPRPGRGDFSALSPVRLLPRGDLGDAAPLPVRRLHRGRRGCAADGGARHPGGERSRPPVPGRSNVQEGPMVLPLLRGRGAPAPVRRGDRTSRRLARAQRRGNGGPAHFVSGRGVVPAPLGRLSLLDERTPRRGPRRRSVRGREHPGRFRPGERHPRHRGPVPGGPRGRLPGPRTCPHRGERAFRRACGRPPPDPRARIGQPWGKGRTPRAGKRGDPLEPRDEGAAGNRFRRPLYRGTSGLHTRREPGVRGLRPDPLRMPRFPRPDLPGKPLTEGVDLAALRAGLAALFPAADPMSAKISELAGDASTRRYYRVRIAPGASLPSIVVMRYPDEVAPEAELPFLNVHRYLTAAGVPVPAVYRSDPEANLLFLEDAGDTML